MATDELHGLLHNQLVKMFSYIVKYLNIDCMELHKMGQIIKAKVGNIWYLS